MPGLMYLWVSESVRNAVNVISLNVAGEARSEPNGKGVDRRPIWEIVEEVNGCALRRGPESV